MPPKKSEATKTESAAPKAKSTGSHATYQHMITDAIISLKDRNGSSRQSLKKFVRANNKITVTEKMFDSLFNKALKTGVEKGVFEQPKGPSGGTKLAKKGPAAAKPAVKKETKEKKPAAPKKAAPKKAAPKKEAAPKEKKEAAPKKAAAPKEKKAAPPKKAAPAEKKKDTMSKTKTGRVTKPAAKPKTAKPAAKPAAKKAAAPKKEKAKKADKPAEASTA